MNIPDIEAFVALAETGSVNRAAFRLNLTQPAVTRRLQGFEAALSQASLLDRSAKPPVLTPLGHQVLENCRRVLRAVEILEASAMPGIPSGNLRVGVAHGMAEMALSAPLDELRSRYPAVRLRISADWTVHLIEKIRSGGLDCAIGLVEKGAALPIGVKTAAIGVEDLEVVGARSLSLPRRKPLSLHDLSGLGWILNPPGCGYRRALERVFDRESLALDLVAEVFGHDLQLSLAARGAGLTIAPRQKVKSFPERDRLMVVRVAELDLQSTVSLLSAGALGSLGDLVNWLHGRLSEAQRVEHN